MRGILIFNFFNFAGAAGNNIIYQLSGFSTIIINIATM